MDTTYRMPFPRRQLATMTLIVEGGMLVVALVLGIFLGPDLLDLIKTDGMDTMVGGIIGVGLLALIVSIVDGPLGKGSGLRDDVDQIAGMFVLARPVDLVWISLLAGLGEEALFRGFLFHHAEDWLGLPLAIIVTSLLFGLLHALSLAYVLFTTALGVIMCGLYLWSDNLALPMAAHATYDLAALLYVNYLRPKRLESTP